MHELLDRFEILYPDVPEMALLRRLYIDKDISSALRLLPKTDISEDLWDAVMGKSIGSVFNLLPKTDHDVLRSAVMGDELHSIFKLCEDDDLRKFILEDNTWKVWGLLRRYIDTQFVEAFKSFFVNETQIWNDCFARGQLRSKMWLIDELKKTNVDCGTVFLCAGWYATLAVMLFESDIKVDKIRSFDLDPTCADIAETFNKPWVENEWRFKASTADIMNFKWSTTPSPSDATIGNVYYQTTDSTGKQVRMKDTPDTIINTSCEHIENFHKWYSDIPHGKLVVLQSNNFYEVDEHVNCVKDIVHFKRIAPMRGLLYSGELELEKYTRFMLIGYK
jgi:hypothetical protein